MLVRDTKNVYRSAVKKAVGENATADDVLNHLFGRYGEDPKVDFVIREWREDKRTPMQRLNMFWAMPLTIICMPYQYVIKGQCGWDTKTHLAAGFFVLPDTYQTHEKPHNRPITAQPHNSTTRNPIN